jgi:S1-C subfamily serine protease
MFTEESQPMEPRVSAFWARIRAHRLASTLSILATLALGILIGTVISFGVKGQEKNTKSSDATPLTVPSPQQLSNQFSQVAKQLEPSVVNINTESVIKTSPHTRRRGGQQQPMTIRTHSRISLTAFSAVKGDRGMAARFERSRWGLESLWIPKATSLPIAMWWKKPIASG